MKSCLKAFLGAGTLVLAGCTMFSNSPAASDLLAGAHQSLEEDDTASARQWLAGAEGHLDSARDHKEYELLAAELDIRTGRPELAEPAVDRLLQSNPGDPRVQELAGKTRFALADYAEASRHFESARQRYRREHDIDRSSDLVALSNGFDAYARGRLATARDHWGQIKDRDLRQSVFSAAGGSGALARSKGNSR